MWTYNQNTLSHHGVKGMKWGVRRYQNADGSLTPAGKKRYGKMSDDKLRKTLYKQVKDERARQSDWSNKWNVSNTIGKHSKAVQDRYNKDQKEYMNSDAFKKAKKEWRKLDDMFDSGKIDPDEYNTKYEQIRKSVYRADLDNSVRISDKGRQYSKAYLDKYGRDYNVAYLKDLGYNETTAKELAERVLKANKKLLYGM